MKKIVAVVAGLVIVAGIAHAAVTVTALGRRGANGYPLTIDSDGVISVNGAVNSKEVVTTAGATLANTDCGATYVVSPSTTLTYNLPTASSIGGCKFQFVQTDGGAIKKMVVNPQDTDKLRGVINSAAADTFAMGDSTISPGNTNDSIAVISNGGTVWDVTYIRGSWTDNN